MTRYLWPALMFAATAWVHHHNTTEAHSKLVLPFVEVVFPDAAGDPAAMGARTVQLLAGLSALSLLWTIWAHLEESRRRRQLHDLLRRDPE